MTFPVARRPKRSRKAVPLNGLPTITPFLVATLILCAGCTPTTYSILRDPPDYVDHVLEDVTAIVEGMANAHAADRVVYRDPGTRSSR